MKPTVAVDFDGVLNLYEGWKGGELYGPRPGAAEFLRNLSTEYEVIIYTTRDDMAVKAWLTRYGMIDSIANVSSTKPPAICYIDDRAILFEGKFDGLIDKIRNFSAHWEQKSE